MNPASIYCESLDQLDRAEACCALHQALMQFNAISQGCNGVDNRPVMAEIARLLKVAGHIGFIHEQEPRYTRALDLGLVAWEKLPTDLRHTLCGYLPV